VLEAEMGEKCARPLGDRARRRVSGAIPAIAGIIEEVRVERVERRG
jgi:hypothetical protein